MDTRRSFLKLGKTTALLSSLALVGAFSGCNSKNNAGGITTPEAFVNNIVEMAKKGTIPAGYLDSNLAKAQANQPGYFVIWDSHDLRYIAININTYDEGTLDQAVMQFVNNDEDSPAQAGVLVTPDGNDSAGNPLYISSTGVIYSHDFQTRDVDLQRAQLQNQSVLKTAAAISMTFQMSMNSAVQVATLADKIHVLSSSNQITADDRQAITQNLAGIAGLTPTEISTAISASMNGNDTVSDSIIAKAAKNLGMPSASTLRDQLLVPAGLISN